jgi:hypothetical protein
MHTAKLVSDCLAALQAACTPKELKEIVTDLGIQVMVVLWG